jgi:hypothetical protein
MKTSSKLTVPLALWAMTCPAHAQTAMPSQPASSTPAVQDTNVVANANAEAAKGPKHLHNGFFLRFGAGLGMFLGTASVGSADLKLFSGAIPIEIAAGGSPIPGLTIGGGLYPTIGFPRTSVSGGGLDNANSGILATDPIGLFVDGYPNPSNGFHVEGAVALGLLTWAKGAPPTPYRPQVPTHSVGAGRAIHLVLGVGYEWWVASVWSMGAMFRVAYASGSLAAHDDATLPSVHVTTWAPGVLFTTTYQ